LALDIVATLVVVDTASLEAFHDFDGEVDFHSKPTPVLLFADGKGGAAPAERIQDQVARARAHFDYPVQDLRGEGVRPPLSRLELPVAHRGYVGPYILEVDAFWVHGVTVPAIVLDFSSAMTARLDGRPDPPERLGPAFRVVEETVVAGVEPSRNREAS